MIAAGRAAFVIATALVLIAMALSFFPVSTNAVDECGTWWTTSSRVEGLEKAADELDASVKEVGRDLPKDMRRKDRAMIADTDRMLADCEDARRGRMFVAIGVGAAAILLPAILLFVASGAQQDRRNRAP